MCVSATLRDPLSFYSFSGVPKLDTKRGLFLIAPKPATFATNPVR